MLFRSFNNNLEIIRSGSVPSLLISGGVTGGNGATVRLIGAGQVGSSVQIDMSTYDPLTNDPTSRIRAVDENYSSNMLFQTKAPGSTAGTLTTRMYVQNDGKIGINTTSPAHQLHIEGGLYVGTTSGVLLSSADRPMITRGWDAFSSGNYAGAGRWGLFMEGGATTLGIPAGGVFRRHQFVSYNADSTINKTMMTIHENGNVGIGTDSGSVPTHRLSVSGGSAYISGGITAGTTLNVNTVNMTPNVSDIFSQLSFTAANNVTSASSITGLSFSNATVRAFDTNIAVNVVCSDGNRYAIFNVKGVQRASNNWTINTTFVGDNNTGVTFSINTSGSLQYISSNIATYTSSSFSFKANTITV